MEVAVEAVREQVDRLLHSKTFEASDVHRRLLQYLADKAISGEADRLKEYTVGIEAFRKPETYDPKHDSIVRLQVGRLRQKLAVYYQNEANGDTVLVTLPKGAFKLQFETVDTGHRKELPGTGARRLKFLVAALVIAVLWAAAASIFAVRYRRAMAPIAENWSSDLEVLWEPFLESKRPLLVCLGTPLFVRFPGFGFFRDPKANDWEEIQRSERINGVRNALGDQELLPSYAFTGAGEASAAFLLARLLSARKHDLLLTRSSILSWQQVADNDLVFIGPPKFNPQLQAAALDQDIVVEANGIRNRKPQRGEPAFLEDRIQPGKTNEGETHAVITRAPAPSGVGEILVIAGNASPDTFAAAEWLTLPRRARELVSRLRTPSGEVPRYFQAVLKVEFKQGIPVHSAYVFHHVLPDSRAGGKGR
jgi:hypothetical protein